MMYRSQAWWKSVSSKVESESFLLRALIDAVNEYFSIDGLSELSFLPGSMPIVDGKSGFSRKILNFFSASTYNALTHHCNRFADYMIMIDNQTPSMPFTDLLKGLSTMKILPVQNSVKRLNTKKIKRSISSEREKMQADFYYQRSAEVLRSMRAELNSKLINTVYIIPDVSKYTIDKDTNSLLLLPPAKAFVPPKPGPSHTLTLSECDRIASDSIIREKEVVNDITKPLSILTGNSGDDNVVDISKQSANDLLLMCVVQPTTTTSQTLQPLDTVIKCADSSGKVKKLRRGKKKKILIVPELVDDDGMM